MQQEFNVMENELYTFNLKAGNSIILNFYQTREDLKEIEFISYSPKLMSFKMLVSTKENPSSENTISVIPSWLGGYFSSVNKGSLRFCYKCSYYILLEAERSTSDINFMIKYEDSVNKIKSYEPIYSTLKPFHMHCYSYEITEANKNETLIIQTMLFSGSATLGLNPWNNPRTIKADKKFKFEDLILNENIKIISPEDRKETNIGKILIIE